MEKEGIVVTICVTYFTAMVLIGIITTRRDKATSDYLVAERKLSVTMTVITLVAVQIGMGIVLSSVISGHNLGTQPGMYYASGYGEGLIIAGLVTTKKPREQGGCAPLDCFAQRCGESKAIRPWAWISNVSNLLGIFIAQFLTSGGILTGFGIPFKTGVVVTAVVILICRTVGGMWGVILADVAQTTIIAVDMPIPVAVILIQYMGAGGSAGKIFATPSISAGIDSGLVYLVLPFLLPVSVSYDTYSRIQSSKDAKTAKIDCIIGGILVIIIGRFCSTAGVATRSLFPGVTDGIFTIATTGALPLVLAGIVTATTLAVAMPSANCMTLFVGASFVRDFYNRFLHPEMDNLGDLPKSKLISQATVFVGSLTGIFSTFHMMDILDAMIILSRPYMESPSIPLSGGLVWKGATGKGAFAAATIGGIVGVASFLSGIPGPLYGRTNTDFSLMIAYLVSAAFLILFGMADRKAKNQFVYG